MNKFTFKTRYGTFERVNKKQAINLFLKQHKTIYIVANKCRCDYTHPMTYPAALEYEAACEYVLDNRGLRNWFNNMINSFEYYNCNSEFGYYAAFYIKTDIAY